MLTELLPRPTHMAAMGVHKALGVTILVLTIVRIVWRLGHKVPPLPDAVPAWQRPLSKIVHFLFYALLILLPLSGWLWMSAADRPIDYFGLFDLPSLDRKSVVLGKSVSVRVGLGGRRIIKKKKKINFC